MKTIRDFDVQNKRVLVRCDFNVPLSESGQILDDFRIKKTIPTIEYLIENGAKKIILMSHLGRPTQIQNSNLKSQNFSLKPISERLSELLGREVKFFEDCVDSEIEKLTNKIWPDKIMLLENLRFHKEEEGNDDNFAKELSRLGDIYINDAFSVSHRAHASVAGIAKYLPSAAGLLLEKEVLCLTRLSTNPAKPMVVIIGGKKVEDKSKVIDNISKVADIILVSGLIEKEIKEKNLKFKYREKIICPVDETHGGLDVGPETIKLFSEEILKAKTIFWNGPFGKIEEKEFSKGTEELAMAIIDSGAYSIIGGGETVEFINQLGLLEKFSHVSTGGGAMLEFLSGKELPGLKVLE